MNQQIQDHSQQVVHALLNHRHQISSILSQDLSKEKICILDNSENNLDLSNIDIGDTKSFTNYVFDYMRNNDCLIGIGRYNEDRVIYRHSSLFANENEPRSLHLGIDIFAFARTPLFAPLDGTVHSFQNNTARGDYGPTIILQHELDNIIFYTLYGHLSRESIETLRVGQKFSAGGRLAEIGNQKINGGWPPHVHFEIITDMLGKRGDFFGVAPLSQREYFTTLCPDPNLILRIPGL